MYRSVRPLPLMWLVVALCVATAAACSDAGTEGGAAGAPGRGIYIPATWQDARAVTGHDVHVVTEKIACAKCHELTGDSLGAVTPESCKSCHEKEGRLEHASKDAAKRFGAGTKTDCISCHAFTDGGTGHPPMDAGGSHAFSATDCVRCHNEKQGTTPAVEIHGTSACVKCHRPHDDAKPKPGSCPECHGDVETSHAARGKPIITVCTTCHQHQHGPAADARATCAECHAKQKPVIPAAALFEGHRECVGCHQPHQFEKTSPVGCRTCHEDTIVLGEQRVKQHAQCNSCHSPHDVKGTPAKACPTCHTEKRPNHPKKGIAGTCVGCHDAHPSRADAHTRARNCSSCHQTAASDKGFHGATPCRQCHTPHQFVRKLSDHSTCQSCHQTQLASVAKLSGHQSCEGCHKGLPHRPTARGAACESCHAKQQREANRGHQKCTGCHEPHAGEVKTACGSCHQAEHKSAPAGHRECKNCHEEHSGSAKKATCQSCHAAEAKTGHGGLKQGCGSCHRPHGPKGVASPPACTSCHQTSALQGLHQIDKHQACATCHSGHGPTPAAARTACLSCHAERKNHFPDAPRCASCHLFTKTR